LFPPLGFLTLTGKSKESVVRITSKGQVTIPADIREAAGLLPHTEVDFEIHDGMVRIVRYDAPKKKPSRGAQIVAHLRAHKGDISMTTDEIMALTRGD
jgi:AbrB family looped-hinge helix DNA binding protein